MSHTDVGYAMVNAPREDVFAALVDEEARMVWLPPTGMSGRFSWLDASPAADTG